MSEQYAFIQETWIYSFHGVLSSSSNWKFWLDSGFIAVSGFVYFMPWLARLAPQKTGLNNLLRGMKEMKEMFYQSIQQRQRTHSGEKNDFIDYYLSEIERTTDPTSSFYKEEGSMYSLFLIEPF